MRILALADLHMGAGAAYADDRLADQTKVLEQVAQIAFDEDIGLVLIAGDVFHRPRPTPATLLAFRKFVDALAVFEIPTIAITGNAGHDIEAGDRPCALDLFESRWFRVSRRPELIWDFVDGVNVATLPSVPVSRLVSQADSVERGPIFAQAAEALLAIAAELRRDAGNEKPTILMGHWAVSGSSLPNGLPVDSLNEPILDSGALERLGYHAMMFGHIHKPQVINNPGGVGKYDTIGRVIYCGSPMNIDFGEPHKHGCWIIDPGKSEAFFPLEDRPFVTIEADLTTLETGGMAPTPFMLSAIGKEHARQSFNGAVVRIRYRASEEQQRRLETDTIKRAVMELGASKVFQISAEIVKQDRARVQGVDENLDPAAALGLWCEANEISDGEGLADLLGRYLVTAP